MVLGVYFHLLADIYCHRATVPLTMAFQSADSTKVWSSMVYGSSDTVSKIAGSHMSNASGLLTAVQNASGMPMIRLNDYLTDTLTITYDGTSYSVTDAGAYEDIPFFYSNRYSVSISAISSKLTSIWNDTADTNTYTFSTYSTVPLSSWAQ